MKTIYMSDFVTYPKIRALNPYTQSQDHDHPMKKVDCFLHLENCSLFLIATTKTAFYLGSCTSVQCLLQSFHKIWKPLLPLRSDMWLPVFKKPQSERSHTKLVAKISGSHVKFLRLPKKIERLVHFIYNVGGSQLNSIKHS
jgi:hypothetical protein